MKTRCLVPECESANRTSYYRDEETGQRHRWVPQEADGTCSRYVPKTSWGSSLVDDEHGCETYVELVSGRMGEDQVELRACDKSELVLDRSVRQDSLAAEFGLICEDAYRHGLLGTTYMAGMLVGSPVAGAVADARGRLVAVAACCALMAAAGVATAAAPGVATVAVLRFLTGAGAMGALMCNFVLLVETLPASEVVFWALLFNIPFAVGETILGLEAYLIRDWRTLHIVAFAPTLLLPAVYFLVRESPRWLMAVGREKEALDVMREVAAKNGRDVNMDDFRTSSSRESASNNDQQAGRKESFYDLIRSRTLVLRCLWMFYQWFACTMGYFGLSFSSTSLSGDAYLNFCLNVFIEVPSYLFVALFLDCWGRRPVLVLLQAVSGVSCIAAGLLHGYRSLWLLQLLLSLAGKFGSTAAFSIVYLYTAELFPTAYRSSVTGACSAAARVGAALSLLIQHLGIYWGPLPMVLLGGTSLVAGILATRFPETTGRPMPDSIEQAEKIGRDGSEEEALWHYDWDRSPIKKMCMSS